VSDRFALGLARCVVRGTDPFRDALLLAADDPEDWRKLQTAVALAPADLDPEQSEALTSLLNALVRVRAPEIVVAGPLGKPISQHR
jgi:hypothetical protein